MTAETLAIIPCRDGIQEVLRRPGLGRPTTLHLIHRPANDTGDNETLLLARDDTETDYQVLLKAASAAEEAIVTLDHWHPPQMDGHCCTG